MSSDLPCIPLNVLDLAHRGAEGTHAEAVNGSVRLAQTAEELDYKRFWVAEHHGMPAIASSAPSVLIAAIAAQTRRIRVGSGGVMLPNHAPLVVAEQFGTLRALYGDRIDLGIGRAPGTDPMTAAALRRSQAGLGAEEFPQHLADLVGFFHGMDAANPLARITAIPGLGDAPQIWLLGSSGFSARLAASLGLPFAFAHHFAAANTEAALEVYRTHFEPSAWLDEPHSMIAVNVVTDPDPEEVRRQSLPGSLMFLRMRQGQKPEPVSIDEAMNYDYSPVEREFIQARNARQAIGTPDEVAAQLSALLAATEADELMVASAAATGDARATTLRLVADLFAA